VVAHHDALGERLVHRHAQAPAQFGQPHQQQAQAPLGIHGVVGQQAQVFEHVVAQMLGFVDHQQRVDLGLEHQARDLAVDGAVGRSAVALHGQP
jgi:hypothetical protein